MKNIPNMRRIRNDMIAIVRKAIAIIRTESHKTVIHDKRAYDGIKEDVVTSGDLKAQQMYIRELRKRFPTFGIIAEEKELDIPCTDSKHDIWFTVDPVDGTKSYALNTSQGVTTMLGLVCDGKVIATYIGDINTEEIYGFAKGTRDVGTRLRFGKRLLLKPDIKRPLKKQYVVLKDLPTAYPEIVQRMVDLTDSGLFKNAEVAAGSIGAVFAKVWKGEVGAVIVRPHFETPWDLIAPLGLSKQLGLCFLHVGETIEEFDPVLIRKITHDPYCTLVTHLHHLPEIRTWIKKYGNKN